MRKRIAFLIDTEDSNHPVHEVEGKYVNTRIWKNHVTDRKTELVADFKRCAGNPRTRAFTEQELREIAIGSYKAWRICRRHRRRQTFWQRIWRQFF